MQFGGFLKSLVGTFLLGRWDYGLGAGVQIRCGFLLAVSIGSGNGFGFGLGVANLLLFGILVSGATAFVSHLSSLLFIE